MRVSGAGPAVLLPVRFEPYESDQAEVMRQWGAHPELGPNLIAGLASSFTVIAADYEGHRMSHPAADSLTPDNVAADLLAIADAAGADRFAYYGYSWLALSGLQLAIRSRRLSALIMGGFPPVDGPYAEMLAVTRAAHSAARSVGEAPRAEAVVEPGDWDSATVQADEAQTRQFVTLYEGLQDFDDRAAQAALTIPKLCFAGAEDTIEYGARWGGVTVDLAGPLTAHQDRLRAAGWTVEILAGLDHVSAMSSSAVLPLVRSWLHGHRAGLL